MKLIIQVVNWRCFRNNLLCLYCFIITIISFYIIASICTALFWLTKHNYIPQKSLMVSHPFVHLNTLCPFNANPFTNGHHWVHIPSSQSACWSPKCLKVHAYLDRCNSSRLSVQTEIESQSESRQPFSSPAATQPHSPPAPQPESQQWHLLYTHSADTFSNRNHSMQCTQ